MKSREESPEEGVSPEEKSFSVKKGVKCTAIFKGKLTEQEVLSAAGDNISLLHLYLMVPPLRQNCADLQSKGLKLGRVGHEVGCCDNALTAVARLLPVPKLAVYNRVFNGA